MKASNVMRLGYLHFAAALVGFAWILVAYPWPGLLYGLAIFGGLGFVTGRATQRVTYLRKTLGASLSSPSYRRWSAANLIAGLVLFTALGATVVTKDWRFAFLILVESSLGIAMGTVAEVLHQRKRERLEEPLSLNADVEGAVVGFLAGQGENIVRDSELKVLMRPCTEITWRGGVRNSDGHFTLMEALECDSLTEDQNRRLSEIFAHCFVGFFRAGANGIALVDIRLVRQRFGFSVKMNYPEATPAFINFSRTYWTLKAVIQEAELGERKNAGLAMLVRLDELVGPLFFPFFTPPGSPILDPLVREGDQRKFLAAFAPNIDVEAFMQGNPILIRDRRALQEGERQAMNKAELDSYISSWFEERGRGPSV